MTEVAAWPANDVAIDPGLLRQVLTPRRIAVIGAKDGKGHFLGSGAVVQALERLGYDGQLHLVARSGAPAFGQPTLTRAADIEHPVDHAAVAIPASYIPGLLPDLAAAGITALTTLASGFAETGRGGAARQAELATAAARAGITLIGPNCLGFVNFVERTGVWFSGLPSIQPGPVAIVSQSGGVGDALMEYASNLGIGLSYLITTGNELHVTVTDALGFLVEDPATKAIAVFAEALRKPAEFRRITARAAELGKAIVMLKAGASEGAARNAISHTGSLVGDDTVITAVLRQAGVVRVRSLEELITTAHLIAATGPVRAGGVGVVSLSGGSCSIVADAAAAAQLALPELAPATATALHAVLSDFAAVQNPLDVTGAADERTFENVLQIVARQPDIAMLAVLCNVPTHESGATENVADRLESIGRGMRHAGQPAVLLSQTDAHLHPFGRDAVRRSGIPVALPGLQLGTAALERLLWWSGQRRRPVQPGPPAAARGSGARQALSEWESRQLLQAYGVPFVPAELVTTRDAAQAAGARYPGPLAVKVVSPDLPHKSEAGGVVLGVQGLAGAGEAFDAVTSAGSRVAGARIHGAIVSPLRPGGTELIVGVTRDEQWGLMLLVGLGGVFVEVYADTAQRALPASPEDIRQMLGELRGRTLLDGHRGRPGANLEALVRVICAVATAAEAMGDQLESLEINPLLADGDTVEALDALAVLREAQPEPHEGLL